MTTGVVVGSIFLSADQKLRVEELSVSTGADLVNGRRVQIDEDGSGHMLAGAGLGEESLVGATIKDILCVRVWSTVGSEAMLEKIPRSTRKPWCFHVLSFIAGAV